MIQHCLEGVWRVSGGAWGLKDHPVLTLPRDCNAYLFSLPSGPALVDCASWEAMPILERNIREAGFDPRSITDLLLTHSHNDHTGSAARWSSERGVKVHLSEVGAEYLERGDMCLCGDAVAGTRFGSTSFPVDHRVRDNETFEVAGTAVRSFLVPGHTPDSCLYVLESHGKRIGLCGDVCFATADWDQEPGIIGALRTTWKSDLAAYRESLKRMADIEVDALLPGHGFWIEGSVGARETILAALRTIERFLNTPKTYAFGIPWRTNQNRN